MKQIYKKSLPLVSLKESILKLNHGPDIPFNIIPDGGDLVASWKIVDAMWTKIFGVSGLTKQYELRLSFDPDMKTVYYKEKSIDIIWDADLENFSMKKKTRRGSRKEFSRGGAWGIREDGSFGKEYAYTFRTRDIKNPIFDVVRETDWSLKLSATDRVGYRAFYILIVILIICGLMGYLM